MFEDIDKLILFSWIAFPHLIIDRYAAIFQICLGSASTISHINYWDQVNFWKNVWTFWNSPLCRSKSGPFLLLNVATYWQSSHTKACAKKLSQILANNIDHGRRGIGLTTYLSCFLKKLMKNKRGLEKPEFFLV